jgi:hypothetical protein
MLRTCRKTDCGMGEWWTKEKLWFDVRQGTGFLFWKRPGWLYDPPSQRWLLNVTVFLGVKRPVREADNPYPVPGWCAFLVCVGTNNAEFNNQGFNWKYTLVCSIWIRYLFELALITWKRLLLFLFSSLRFTKRHQIVLNPLDFSSHWLGFAGIKYFWTWIM